jgi:hypothetical protein
VPAPATSTPSLAASLRSVSRNATRSSSSSAALAHGRVLTSAWHCISSRFAGPCSLSPAMIGSIAATRASVAGSSSISSSSTPTVYSRPAANGCSNAPLARTPGLHSGRPLCGSDTPRVLVKRVSHHPSGGEGRTAVAHRQPSPGECSLSVLTSPRARESSVARPGQSERRHMGRPPCASASPRLTMPTIHRSPVVTNCGEDDDATRQAYDATLAMQTLTNWPSPGPRDAPESCGYRSRWIESSELGSSSLPPR